MKPPKKKVLVFLFDQKDVSAFLDQKLKPQNCIIYSSGKGSGDALTAIGWKFSRVTHYISIKQVKTNYQKAHMIASQFHPSIYASVRLLILELLRSIFVTKKYLNSFHPDIVYLPKILNESPFQKYHSPTFNLLPQVLISLCHRLHIPVKLIHCQQPTGSLFSIILKQAISNLKHYLTANTPPTILPTLPAILVSASDYHLDNLKPLITAASKNWFVAVLGKSDVIGHLDPFSFLNLFDLIKIWLLQAVAAIKLIFPNSRLRWKITLNKLGIDPWPELIQTFNYWQLSLVPQGKLLSIAFKRLIKFVKPKVLTSSNSIDNFNRVLHLSAQSNNIPDLVILHYPMMTILDAIEETGGVENTLFTSGTESLRLFRQVNPKFKVIQTGLPTFDKYFSKYKQNVVNIIPKNSLKILFLLSQSPLYFQNPIGGAVFQALIELDDLADQLKIEVTLRPHPDQYLTGLDIQRRYPVKIDNQTQLSEQLSTHHIVITHTTSAAIDAMIMKKPLIYFNTFGTKNYSPFATDGAALGVYKTNQLIPAIRSLIKYPDQLVKHQQKFLKIYCNNIDGQASRRIIKQIETICDTKT